MITECKEKDTDTIISYIGKDYGRCLYIYIDLKKYGLSNENFNAWIQRNESDEICAIITEYYKGVQIYSKNVDLIPEEIAEFIKEKNTGIVLGMKESIDKIHAYLPDFTEEYGCVGTLKELKYPAEKDAYCVSFEELPEVVELVAADEAIGKPYGYDSMYAQYSERMQEGFGRNFILRDKSTGDIICHAGTYAELPELAVIGGVITAPEYRGKGYSKGTLAAICAALKEEGKDIFSFFYIPAAMNMHYGVGFEKIGDWAKIMKGGN